MTTYIIIASSLSLIIVLSYFRNKRAKSNVICVIDDKCTGCGRCVKICRHKALGMTEGETGRCAVVKDPGKCTACKDCMVVCKFDALALVAREAGKKG
jgi:ferredoxin